MPHTIILILHVLGAGFLFSLGIFSLVLTSRGPVSKELLKTIAAVGKLAPIAVLNQFITGIGLYSYKRQILNTDPVFWIKIALFLISGFLAGNLIKKKRISLMKQKTDKIKLGNFRELLFLELLVTLTIISLGVILVETI